MESVHSMLFGCVNIPCICNNICSCFSTFVIFSLLISICSVNAEQNSGVFCVLYEFHIVPEEKIRVGRDYQAVVPELIPLSGMFILCLIA